jgi:hypothetical protein
MIGRRLSYGMEERWREICSDNGRPLALLVETRVLFCDGGMMAASFYDDADGGEEKGRTNLLLLVGWRSTLLDVIHTDISHSTLRFYSRIMRLPRLPRRPAPRPVRKCFDRGGRGGSPVSYWQQSANIARLPFHPQRGNQSSQQQPARGDERYHPRRRKRNECSRFAFPR